MRKLALALTLVFFFGAFVYVLDGPDPSPTCNPVTGCTSGGGAGGGAGSGW